MDHRSTEEAALVRRVQARDDLAFREIVDRYQSKVYSGSKYGGDLQYIDPYTIVNARLTWENEGGDLSASLEVTNLTNKYYYLTLFDLRDAGAGLDKAQPGRPREWALTVKKSF